MVQYPLLVVSSFNGSSMSAREVSWSLHRSRCWKSQTSPNLGEQRYNTLCPYQWGKKNPKKILNKHRITPTGKCVNGEKTGLEKKQRFCGKQNFTWMQNFILVSSGEWYDCQHSLLEREEPFSLLYQRERWQITPTQYLLFLLLLYIDCKFMSINIFFLIFQYNCKVFFNIKSCILLRLYFMKLIECNVCKDFSPNHKCCIFIRIIITLNWIYIFYYYYF